MARRKPRRHIDSRASHAIQPHSQGLFHECNRLVDRSRGARIGSRAAGRRARRHDHGQCDPRAGDGRGRTGEIRPSWPAHGRRRYGDRAVLEIPEIRSGRSGVARPRPFRALGRPRLDADLCTVVSHRLRVGDHRRDQALPPARLQDAGPSGKFHHDRHRDHHRPARPGHRQCRRHGDRGAAHGGRIRQRGGRSQNLCVVLRRRPDGRHQPGSHRAGRSYEIVEADRAVRRQRHFDRRRAVALGLHRSGQALRGVGLERFAHRRTRPGRDRRRA